MEIKILFFQTLMPVDLWKRASMYTAGSAKIHPRPTIKKTPPTKVRPFFNTYVWVKFMLKFLGYVSQAILEILDLKGPKLTKKTKYILEDLESKMKPLFHTFSCTTLQMITDKLQTDYYLFVLFLKKKVFSSLRDQKL